MGRTPRFGGAFRVGWWSVLHHSIAMDDAACAYSSKKIGSRLLLERRLYALVHDAHEAATGDIPSPWKNEAIRQAQHALTLRIYKKTLGVPYPDHHVVESVKALDVMMMHGEGLTLGPVYWKDIHPLVSCSDRLRGIIDQVHKQYPRYDLTSQEDSPAVICYLNTVREVVRDLLEPCTT